MGGTIRARVKRGLLEPLEKIDLPEGEEVVITIVATTAGPDIGRKLRELREQRHLTQQEMADRAGVPRTYISRIENARLVPGPTMLHRIASALEVSILDLLPGWEAFRRSAGGWKGSVDADALIRNIYSDRLILTRAEPRL